MHAQPLSPRPTSPAVRSMGVDHSPSATVSPTADGNCAAHATVRPGSGVSATFYRTPLVSVVRRRVRARPPLLLGRLPLPLCPVAGGRSTTPPASTCTPSSPSTTRLIETARSISAVDSRRSSHASKPSRSCPTAGSTPTRSRAIAMRGSGSVSSTTRGGLGLGRRLFEERVQWARDQGADMAFAFGWEHPGRTSRPLFEAFGFVPVERFKRLYEDERDVPCL